MDNAMDKASQDFEHLDDFDYSEQGLPIKDQKKTEEVIDGGLLSRLNGPSSGKAGLKRDPDEVAKIIYEASKGSPFFLNEQKRNEQLSRHIETTLNDLDRQMKDRKGDLSREEHAFERLCKEVELTRQLDQTVVVVDCDAFFASVEELLDPSLRGSAFGVGSSVLSTASYEARKYGCRSGMAGHIAKKLCPHLLFVKGHYDEYKKYSNEIFDILRLYDPDMMPASLDEAYLNITQYLCDHPEIPTNQLVENIRQRVKNETGLTVSAGVAPNKRLAKIAADFNKPDGQYVIENSKEECMKFTENLPVRKIPGIGRVKERWLNALGVNTCKDIWTQRGKLYLVESSTGLEYLIQAYLGIGSTLVQVSDRSDRQSISSETTFATLSDLGHIYEKIDRTAKALSNDIKRLGYSGRTITLKLKLDTFEVVSRSRTNFSYYRGSAEEIFNAGKELFDKEMAMRHEAFDSGRPVLGCRGSRNFHIRLLGLRLSNLRDEKESKGNELLDMWSKKKAQDEEHKYKDIQCPICKETWNVMVDDQENVIDQRFNMHIDKCLSGGGEGKKNKNANDNKTHYQGKGKGITTKATEKAKAKRQLNVFDVMKAASASNSSYASTSTSAGPNKKIKKAKK